MARWPTLVPLGAIAVTPGTPVLLSVNCGPLQGQVGSYTSYDNPPLPGTPLRQIILTAVGSAAFLLPRGSTLAANPGNILAYLPVGIPVSIPYGLPFENGILPENLVLDAATGTPIVYGCGIIS